jgi:hypothetical protein
LAYCASPVDQSVAIYGQANGLTHRLVQVFAAGISPLLAKARASLFISFQQSGIGGFLNVHKID